jgi:hypothetical protein
MGRKLGQEHNNTLSGISIQQAKLSLRGFASKYNEKQNETNVYSPAGSKRQRVTMLKYLEHLPDIHRDVFRSILCDTLDAVGM